MASEAEVQDQSEPSQQQQEWPWPDIPNNREEFLTDLESFHAQRETALDKDPKVSNRQIDLWRLFQTVQERGGYDSVSAEKLAWRKLAQEFGLHQPAYAFQVKTIFYKYLAAYAIKNVYHQEPPPKEILEDLTARGGELLTRTRENFDPPSRSLLQENPAEGSGEDMNESSKVEKMEVEDVTSSGRRSLRQAPAPRQIFVPDVSSSRQIRNPSATSIAMQPSPATTGSPVGLSNSRFDPLTYEGATVPPQNLRTVATPLSQPLVFRNRYTLARNQHRSSQKNEEPAPKGLLLPGTGSSGAMDDRVYIRVLNSLRSPMFDDRKWAVHHLVKISEIMGGRFRLDSFSGMAEGLIEVLLTISSLYYEVNWRISYDERLPEDIEVLDGLHGTPDLLLRIGKLTRRKEFADLQDKQFAECLDVCNEVALVLRNLSLLETNAFFLAHMLPVKDLLCIVLHLPKKQELNEMKLNMLEVADQIVKYLPLMATDPLYLGLLDFAEKGDDRGGILAALRAMCHVAYHSFEANLLPSISVEFLNRLHAWTLLEDDELAQASMEFLYQYTAVPSNVLAMLESSTALQFPMHAFVEHLTRLMMHNAKEDMVRREIAPAIPGRKPSERVGPPDSLLNELLLLEEPARASQWLKCMFEEDPKADITQLELWQAYQHTFSQKIEQSSASALMSAADFIKNVSATLSAATAKIVRSPDSNQPRFIMSGIRYKDLPTDPDGGSFVKCLWHTESSGQCGTYHRPGTPKFDHILTEHLGLPNKQTLESLSKEEAKKTTSSAAECMWSSCKHFARCRPGHTPTAIELARHVYLHVETKKAAEKSESKKRNSKIVAPNDPNRAYRHRQTESDEIKGFPAIYEYSAFYDTGMNERHHPSGIPFFAVMTLRNLARNVPKATAAVESESTVAKESSKTQNEDGMPTSVVWMRKLFLPVRRQIFHVLAYNRTLADLAFDLLVLIDKGVKQQR